MKILLDIDDVCVDFDGGVIRAFGLTRKDVEANWPVGTYDIVPAIAATLGEPLTLEDFWKQIKKTKDFWRDLKPYPWFQGLLKLLEPYEWFFCTSDCYAQDPNCAKQKLLWMYDTFDTSFDRYVLTKHKHLLADGNTLLIDDSATNCRRFVANGGHSILWPMRHNQKDWDNPWPHVKDRLAAFECALLQTILGAK